MQKRSDHGQKMNRESRPLGFGRLMNGSEADIRSVFFGDAGLMLAWAWAIELKPVLKCQSLI